MPSDTNTSEGFVSFGQAVFFVRIRIPEMIQNPLRYLYHWGICITLELSVPPFRTDWYYRIYDPEGGIMKLASIASHNAIPLSSSTNHAWQLCDTKAVPGK